MKTIETISNSPFRHLVSTIGELPTSFTESMSYYELLAWLCDYIEKTIIPAVNNNAESVKELQDLFVELKDYVDNYFDNLDVQEEINNKLDAMAEDGTLAHIINEEIFGELSNKVDTNTAAIAATDEALDKKINGFKLNLMRDCIFDLASNDYTQGSCVVGNKIYIMQPTSSNQGNIIILNLETKAYHGIVSNVQMWHGNDAAAVGTKIYIATCSADAGRKLVVFDTANNTTSQLTPFETVSSKTGISGVASYGDGKLLCMLEDITNSAPYNNLNQKEYYIYDTVSGEVTALTYANPKNIPLDSVFSSQSTSCIGNHYYVMTSLDNNIFDFYIDEENETLSLTNVYNLPYYDNSGLLVGEYEGLSNAAFFGDNALMVTSHIIDNEYNNIRTVKCYVINPINGVPNFEFKSSTDITGEALGILAYVDAGSNSLYEDGTSAYPYKTIKRGISAATNGKNIRSKNRGVYLISSSQQTYYAGDIFDCPNLKIVFGDDKQHILHIRRIVGSDVYIQKSPDAGTIGSNCPTVYFDSYTQHTTYGQISNTTLRLDDVNITVAGSQLSCLTSVIQFSNIHSVTCAANQFIYAAKDNVIYDGCPVPTFQGSGTHIAHYMQHSSKLFLGSNNYTASDIGALDSGKLIQTSATGIVIQPGIYSAD